ncbi:MAG TPA: hypothetical protein VJU18_06770 [Vicinamibacteria bacterium]|nr:hypothetical protein [Vicinamibacteria bacterium]
MHREPRTGFAYCDQPLAYAPGSSPFHIKGEFYRQITEALGHYDKKSGGALLPRLERQGLRDFATQPFLASALYDVLPMPRIVMVLAELLGRDVHELTSRMGKAAVEGQMKGVYGRMLAAVTPENFCQRFEQVIKLFYDFGPVSVEPAERGASLVRRGVPLCIAEWWSLVTVPFVEMPLTAAGARDVSLEWRIEPTGVEQGVKVGDVHWDIRWTTG